MEQSEDSPPPELPPPELLDKQPVPAHPPRDPPEILTLERPYEQTENRGGEAEVLQLGRLTYLRTFQASALGMLFITAGLVLLGQAEQQRLAHGGGATATVLLFRVAGWIVMYQVPVQMVAISNLRMLATNSITPGQGPLGFLIRPAFSPAAFGESAAARGMTRGQVRRAMSSPVIIQFLWLLVFVCFMCIPVGQFGFFGYAIIYGVGHLVVIAIGDGLAPKLCPPTDERYANKSGPPCLGVATVGFFIIVAGFSLSKRYLGAWYSGSMVILLWFYEVVGTVAISNFYMKEFIEREEVREAYRGSPQALMPSMVITLLSCHAEGARVTMLIASATFDPDDDGYAVALIATFVICVASRTGCVDAFLSLRTGIDNLSNGRMLLRSARYQSGYPRFFCFCGFVIARATLGHSPSPNDTVTLVVFLTALETVLEDVVVAFLQHQGMHFQPRRFGRAGLRRAAAVVPEPSVLGLAEDRAQGGTRKVEEDAERFDVGFGSFQELPLWGHFSTVMISQFHTVLFMIIFCGGVSSTLGFCDSGYKGISRGIVWWPTDAQEDSLCT